MNMFYVRLMVTKKQKHIVDEQQQNVSMPLQTITEAQWREKAKKETKNYKRAKKQNESSKSLPINNYFTFKY